MISENVNLLFKNHSKHEISKKNHLLDFNCESNGYQKCTSTRIFFQAKVKKKTEIMQIFSNFAWKKIVVDVIFLLPFDPQSKLRRCIILIICTWNDLYPVNLYFL